MLKEILSITGRPGLYKLVSEGKNMFVVQSLIDQKKIPIFPRDKVVSLGDIAIYTDVDEVSLASVFQNIKEKENGGSIDYNPSISQDELRKYFGEVLPNFDKERVYPSDIKKIMSWYNLLLKSGITDFKKVEEEEKEEKEESVETKETTTSVEQPQEKDKQNKKTTIKKEKKS